MEQVECQPCVWEDSVGQWQQLSLVGFHSLCKGSQLPMSMSGWYEKSVLKVEGIVKPVVVCSGKDDNAEVDFFEGDLLVSWTKLVTGPHVVCWVFQVIQVTLLLAVTAWPINFGICIMISKVLLQTNWQQGKYGTNHTLQVSNLFRQFLLLYSL